MKMSMRKMLGFLSNEYCRALFGKQCSDDVTSKSLEDLIRFASALKDLIDRNPDIITVEGPEYKDFREALGLVFGNSVSSGSSKIG